MCSAINNIQGWALNPQFQFKVLAVPTKIQKTPQTIASCLTEPSPTCPRQKTHQSDGRHSALGFRASFVIRHSSFGIRVQSPLEPALWPEFFLSCFRKSRRVKPSALRKTRASTLELLKPHKSETIVNGRSVELRSLRTASSLWSRRAWAGDLPITS